RNCYISSSLVTSAMMLFFFQAEDGIRYRNVTGVQTCALPISVLHQKPFSVLKDKKNTLHIIAYGIFGLLPVQVFYFIAIEMANASIATILQFIGPFFVLTYLAVTHQQVLRRLDVLAAILAFIGVFLLSTHGNFNQLAITPIALLFGLLSALGEASY